MPDNPVAERIAAWQQAGLIDADTAARLKAFEDTRPPAERATGRITVSEVIAYIGAVVLLVGVGFLYGTQYQTLGNVGRLLLIALVAAAAFAAGELIRRTGATTAAARRARSAGWSVGTLAVALWLAELFTDYRIFTRPPQYDYAGASPDASGSLMAAMGIGAVLAGTLLWRAKAGLLAFVGAVLAYATAAAFLTYLRIDDPSWTGEVIFLVAGAVLLVSAEVLSRGAEGRWSREVLRFAGLLVPSIVALIFSVQPDQRLLEIFGGVLAVVGFGLALMRSSAGYAIAGGIALFIFVNEVGFRHFSDTLGFPVVLIVSGIALFVIAGGLVGILRRLRPRG